MKRQRLFTLLGLLAVAAFLYGVTQLFVLRFQAGDVYPEYSSLRADPLGTEVFYESLRSLGSLAVGRNQKPLDKLGDGRNTTLFYLGTRETVWTETEVHALETFMNTGGRLVMSFYPAERGPSSSASPSPSPSASPKKQSSPSKKKDSDDEEEIETEKLHSLTDLGTRWKFGVNYNKRLPTVSAKRRAENHETQSLEPELSWHSAMFLRPGSEWRTVYACGSLPVMIERRFGSGSFVLASDSFFASNEAMRTERCPQLLAWLTGPSSRVIFDEAHQGLFEQPGVSMLMRKYRLHGLIAGLLVLAILFIWKNATSLVPPADATRNAESGNEIVSGRESFAGFVNLLRRGIGPKELLATCIAEWKKNQPQGRAMPDAKVEEIERRARETEPSQLVQTYNEISRIVAESKWKQPTRSN